MRTIKILFGKTGSGKSTFIKKELLPKINRAVIIDPMEEYSDGVVFTEFDNFMDYILDNDVQNADYFHLICRFTEDYEIEYVFKTVEGLTNCTLIVEEAEIYINPKSTFTSFNRLIRYGRHFNVSIIGIARRTTELSTDIRALCTEMISFKQTFPNDLKLMESYGLTGLETLEMYRGTGKHVENIHYKKITY